MKGILSTELRRVKVKKYSDVEPNSKEHLQKIKRKALEYWANVMEEDMKVNFNATKWMVKELNSIQMEASMRGTGKMI